MELHVATILRLIAVFDPGYVHPDEFFQSPEVIAKHVLGFDTDVPWEYSCELGGKLYRSVVSPYMTSGAAFWALRELGWDSSGYMVFLAPRFLLFAVSLVFDWLVMRMFGQRAFYVYRTSWVSIVLLQRPLSNSLETFLLILCFSLAHNLHPFKLGIAVAFGVFNRITFPAFVLPVLLYGLHAIDSFWREGQRKKDHARTSLGRIGNLAAWALAISAGFVFGAAGHVAADSAFAAANPACKDYTVRIGTTNVVLAPLNNLLYNLQPANLAQHGLHPRYTHILLNMQLLYSPIWIGTLMTGAVPVQLDRVLLRTVKAVGFLALLVLSLAPHQEARFLLPLVLPVAVLTADTVTQNRKVRHFWMVFNTILGLLYGVFHQGGLVRSMLALEHDVLKNHTQPICIATYETYTAPRFLLAEKSHWVDAFENLGGMASEKVPAHLSTAGCASNEWYIVLPSTAIIDFGGALSERTRLDTFWPHFSGERPGFTIEDLNLELHRYKLAGGGTAPAG